MCWIKCYCISCSITEAVQQRTGNTVDSGWIYFTFSLESVSFFIHLLTFLRTEDKNKNYAHDERVISFPVVFLLQIPVVSFNESTHR